jgi:urease gamma subunit
MQIKLTVKKENPDGSADAICDYDEEGEEFLVQEGVTAILKQYISQQRGEVQMTDLWEISNEVEKLSYKINNVKDMVEIVAMDAQDPHSGALWGVHDSLETIAQKIECQAQNIMNLYGIQQIAAMKAEIELESELESKVTPAKKAKKK